MQRHPRQHSDAHLKFIRTLPCIVCKNEHETEAAHIRFGDLRVAKPKAGIGEKPDDAFTLPLCGQCHRTQHGMNEKAFWGSVDPVFYALALWRVSGDHERGTQIVLNVETAIAAGG